MSRHACGVRIHTSVHLSICIVGTYGITTFKRFLNLR